MRLDETVHYDTAPVENLLDRLNARTTPYDVDFAGLSLRIEENVFCPTYTKTSAIMLEHLETCDINPGARALDLFSGSGVFALYLGTRGAVATGVDISPSAVACADANVARNGLEGQVSFVLGDCFKAVPDDERFDIVVACPPLLPGHADEVIEKALVDNNLGSTFDFVRDLPKHLNRDGLGLLFLSDVYQRVYGSLHDLAARHGLEARVAHSKDVGYEDYQIVELRHAA